MRPPRGAAGHYAAAALPSCLTPTALPLSGPSPPQPPPRPRPAPQPAPARPAAAANTPKDPGPGPGPGPELSNLPLTRRSRNGGPMATPRQNPDPDPEGGSSSGGWRLGRPSTPTIPWVLCWRTHARPGMVTGLRRARATSQRPRHAPSPSPSPRTPRSRGALGAGAGVRRGKRSRGLRKEERGGRRMRVKGGRSRSCGRSWWAWTMRWVIHGMPQHPHDSWHVTAPT